MPLLLVVASAANVAAPRSSREFLAVPIGSLGHLRPPTPHSTAAEGTLRLRSQPASHRGCPYHARHSVLRLLPLELWRTVDEEWVGQSFSCFLHSLTR